VSYMLLSVREWHCNVDGKSVLLRTDHHPLVWLTPQPHLSPKHTRWMTYLSRLSFELEYARGIDNLAADALSRHPGFGAVTSCGQLR
jgi:hypothetical protein